MTDLARLTADYRVAFLRYLPRREESALATGYELGRSSVASGISVLDLARIHHDILREVLQDTSGEEVADVATVGSDFFLEVLAAYDMAQQSFRARADAPRRPPGS